MRVLVAGAGAIGQWLGARLHAAGHDVVLLVRPRLLTAMADVQVTGHTTFQGRIAAVDAVPDDAAFDAVFVTCKAHATAALAAQVAPCVAADGVLVSLQNGIGNGDKLAMHAPPGQVAVALTSHGVMVDAPGRVRHTGEGVTRCGPLVPEGAAAARVTHGLLADAGLDPQYHDDMLPWTWQKAVANSGINPVAAVHDVPNGRLLDDDLWPDAKALVEEAVALSRAAGVGLPPGDMVQITRDVARRTAANTCSMLQDVHARRPTEIEQITGHFVRLGRRLGYPMFASEDAYRQVKALEAGYLGDEAALALTREQVACETRAL